MEPTFRREGPRRVLLAEDDRDLRELIAYRLGTRGYVVHDVASGVELLRVVSRIDAACGPFDGIDLIVLDHWMPEVTGLEVMARLRLGHPTLPFILITAFPDAEVLARAAALRATVLAKPFALDKLAVAVGEAFVS